MCVHFEMVYRSDMEFVLIILESTTTSTVLFSTWFYKLKVHKVLHYIFLTAVWGKDGENEGIRQGVFPVGDRNTKTRTNQSIKEFTFCLRNNGREKSEHYIFLKSGQTKKENSLCTPTTPSISVSIKIKIFIR